MIALSFAYESAMAGMRSGSDRFGRFFAAEQSRTQYLLRAHDMENQDDFTLNSVKHSAGRLDNLAVSRVRAEFGNRTAASRKLFELADVAIDPSNQRAGRGWVLHGDVVGDRQQVSDCRFGPNYPSHRDSRALTSECSTVRPSAIAISPRAMPSSIPSRFCCKS